MTSYEEPTMEPISPTLGVHERELILVTHNKCVFYSNDGKRGIWISEGKMPLRKKGNGRSIMVSEFISEACGWLKLSEEEKKIYPDIPEEACCYLKPGKNQEGYWTVDHLLKQIKTKAIPIFEAKFPHAIAVFAFYNSTNHAAYADDALVAQKMNLGPGGKQRIMRSTIFVDANGQQKNQEMKFENNYPNPDLRGKPKGIKQVLMERGLWKKELNLDCEMCKKREDSKRIDCCLRKIIAS